MATYEYELLTPPTSKRARELWMQHAAGRIFFEDVRGYAIKQIDETSDEETKNAIIEGIDHALYGLMMVLDGVSGALRSNDYSVELETKVVLKELKRQENAVVDAVTIDEVDLFVDGDGMCMGYHGWQEGDFGEDEIVKIKDEYRGIAKKSD